MDAIITAKITLNDLVPLQRLACETFTEAFADYNTVANMQQYLASNFSEPRLIEELINPDTEFYFALIHNQPIGYLKVNTKQAQTELKHENSLEIERIYVLKAYYGKSVAQILFEKALQLALDKKVNFIWLGVWEKNVRAIRFYEKNGFVPFSSHTFALGDDEQTDLMMRRSL